MGHYLVCYGGVVPVGNLLESVAFLHVGNIRFVCRDVLARLQENERYVIFNRRYNERRKDN